MDSSKTYDVESERLYLQILSEEHLHDYHAIQSNKYSMMWSRWPPDTTLQQTLDRIHENQPTAEAPWNKRWVIILKDNEGMKQKMIGTIGIVREQEIGYKLHPDYWSNGYMSEALKMFLNMFWNAEENKKYNDIFAHADPDNKASMRVLEKAGFQKGVLFKDHYSRPYLEKKVMSDLQGFYLARPETEKK